MAQEEIYVELLIQLDGSAVQNKIATFKLPVVARQAIAPGSVKEDGVGALQFETKALKKAIINAVRKL